MAGPNNLDEYMAALPEGARAGLEEIRRAIREAAPDATEGFSYRMPLFRIDGHPLVWYAAFKDHYSLYPATDGLLERLGKEVQQHFAGKGTLRFDADEPLPTELIQKIVKVRREEAASTYRR